MTCPHDPPTTLALFGWHQHGLHPDRVMRWIEGGSDDDGVFDLRDEDMAGSQLWQDGERVPLPGWWRLLPAVIGGMRPYEEDTP